MKKEQVRNWLHVLGGAIIGGILFQTFSGITIPVQLFLTAFIIGVGGTMWEWGWHMATKSKIDKWDVVRAVVAGIAVVVICNILK